MRNPVVIITGTSSSSSVFASHRHYRRISNPKLPIPTFKLQQSSPSPSSSPSSLSSTFSDPLTPPIPSDDGFSQSNLGYYAEIASALVEEGRFVEFGAIVDGMVDLGEKETADFGRMLNLELLGTGIRKYLGKGRVKGVIQLLSSVAKLRVDVLRLIDGVALNSITMEVRKLVNGGNLKEAVELMELLSGFQFSVRQLVDPNDMIRKCVHLRKPHIAVK